MIITCNNCNKKFDIDSSLIPEKGRLLQCYICNHKWFFKKEIIEEPIKTININESSDEPKSINDKIKTEKIEIDKSNDFFDKTTDDNNEIEKVSANDRNEIKVNEDLNINKQKKKKKNNLLSFIIVFIISFIVLIILLDTFQKPISFILPNIETLLYSLYESIKDILSFLTDLL